MITSGFRAQFSLKEKEMISSMTEISFLSAQDSYFCHGRWKFFFLIKAKR